MLKFCQNKQKPGVLPDRLREIENFECDASKRITYTTRRQTNDG